MIRVKIEQTGSLLPVWVDEEISEEQAEAIGRVVYGTCHLPIWQSVVDGHCTHDDHAVVAAPDHLWVRRDGSVVAGFRGPD